MSLTSAQAELETTVSALEDAITELVMIVHEDRPAASQVAIVDHLAEVVSELQADAVLAGQRLHQLTDPRQLADRLPYVDQALAACAGTYWCELRSFARINELRRTAASRGVEWRTWQRSIELSLLRCEAPVLRAQAAVRSAWQELGELLAHYLRPPIAAPPPVPVTEPDTGRAETVPHPRPATVEKPQMSTRRSS
ncbi:hypothetical protein GCM10011584_00720 [Nocardioides phosphati]|uniref:DUF222 domain-containing protein n=1 Tax=Nocardioides phosphati TaxID=1867775 RepID=A0ABQ2N5K8_9ACTN|nr:hypothetical protein [Nocardioides phosphati]GGO84059.1 hypothetical protein GCM10011584_00720 [Nocardioides phosphati]